MKNSKKRVSGFSNLNGRMFLNLEFSLSSGVGQ